MSEHAQFKLLKKMRKMEIKLNKQKKINEELNKDNPRILFELPLDINIDIKHSNDTFNIIAPNIMSRIKAFIDTLLYDKKQKLFLLLCKYKNSLIVNKFILYSIALLYKRDSAKKNPNNGIIVIDVKNKEYNKYVYCAFLNMRNSNINIFNILELYNETYIDCALLFMLIQYYFSIGDGSHYNNKFYKLWTQSFLEGSFSCCDPINYFNNELVLYDLMSNKIDTHVYDNIPYFVIKYDVQHNKQHYIPICIRDTNTAVLLSTLEYLPIYHIWYIIETNIIKQNQLKLINMIDNISNSDSDSDSSDIISVSSLL